MDRHQCQRKHLPNPLQLLKDPREDQAAHLIHMNSGLGPAQVCLWLVAQTLEAPTGSG